MTRHEQARRWILEWRDDSGDDGRNIRETADSVEEAASGVPAGIQAS
jgi:hypothetical protein